MTPAGAPPEAAAPISPDKLKLMELPTWEESSNLLENPVMREFRLDIETDSAIRMDEEMEKEARLELLMAVDLGAELLQLPLALDLGHDLLDLGRRHPLGCLAAFSRASIASSKVCSHAAGGLDSGKILLPQLQCRRRHAPQAR